VAKSFGPEILWELRMMEDRVDMFHKSPVEGFGNAVVLGCVVGGEVTHGAFLLKELGEFVAGELTATI
jgi:hypothetical protein